MALVSPLHRFHQQAEASLTPYGPAVVVRPDGKTGAPQGGTSGGGEGVLVEVVETFGQLDLEYAALRKSCVVIDQPNRAVLEVTGGERVDFLNRMLTQELKGLKPGDVRRSFWLSRKGRIDADLRAIAREDRVLLEVDVHAAHRTLEGLGAYVISEDVEIRDLTDSTHRLAFHGPGAPEIVARLTGAGAQVIHALQPGHACVAGDVLIFREDATGEVGLELILPARDVVAFYQRAVELFGDDDHAEPTRLRPAGWHAFNIARLEAGTPLYNLDFGVESLPAESGVLHDRVSFSKGCYLGQEIVARMHARQQLKQQLVAVKFEPVTDAATGVPAQPVTGTMLIAPPKAPAGPEPTESLAQAIAGRGVSEGTSGGASGGASGGEPVGVITTSAISPMLGAIPIAFAQVKSAHASPGTTLECAVGPLTIRGQVQAHLRFWEAARGKA